MLLSIAQNPKTPPSSSFTLMQARILFYDKAVQEGEWVCWKGRAGVFRITLLKEVRKCCTHPLYFHSIPGNAMLASDYILDLIQQNEGSRWWGRWKGGIFFINTAHKDTSKTKKHTCNSAILTKKNPIKQKQKNPLIFGSSPLQFHHLLSPLWPHLWTSTTHQSLTLVLVSLAVGLLSLYKLY